VPNRRVGPKRAAAIAGAALLAVAVAFGATRTGGSGARAGSASVTAVAGADVSGRVDAEWDKSLEEALRPLNVALVDLARAVDAHATGARSAEDLQEVLADVRPKLVAVRDAAARLRPHRSDGDARTLVIHMADLYVLSADAHGRSLEVGDAALARQYDLLGRRLRILGDRIFDRAHERTSAAATSVPGLRLALPAEVPDWTRLEMAAGPPLEPADPNRSDALPLERRGDRTTQPVSAWQARVRELAAPSTDDVRAAGADAGALASLARRLVGAADALRSEPVPAGDSGRADCIALGWLVRADAARAGQLAVLAPDDRRAGQSISDALLVISGSPVLSTV
jgi:hypothetical protein